MPWAIRFNAVAAKWYRRIYRRFKTIEKGQSYSKKITVGSLDVLKADPVKIKDFFSCHSTDIAICQTLDFASRFMSSSVDEKLLGSDSAIFINLIMSNSNAELLKHTSSNLISDRDFTDELERIKKSGKQYLYNPDDDQITEYPLEIDGVDFKIGLLEAHIKISEYHKEQIVEAVQLFPDFHLDVSFVCNETNIEHELTKQAIHLSGVAQIDPSKIKISTSSSYKRHLQNQN